MAVSITTNFARRATATLAGKVGASLILTRFFAAASFLLETRLLPLSLAVTLTVLPSMSLFPLAPFLTRTFHRRPSRPGAESASTNRE